MGKAESPYALGDEGSDGGDGGYFESWLPIVDARGDEVVRVGYQFWVHRQCTGFQGTDDERRDLAAKIVDFLNADARGGSVDDSGS